MNNLSIDSQLLQSIQVLTPSQKSEILSFTKRLMNATPKKKTRREAISEIQFALKNI